MVTDHVALITGSSSGIGKAIAEILARQCKAVVLNGVEEGLAELTAHSIDANCQVLGVTADMGTEVGRKKLIRACKDAGLTPDILILNAALQVDQQLSALREADMAEQFAVNFVGALSLVRDFLPDMTRAGWGRVISIGSVQEERPVSRCLAYAASKAALTHAMLNLAKHQVTGPITFNVVRPGAIATRRNEAVLADSAYRSRVIDAIPGGRIGDPHDCSGVVAFLCSDAAAYINGAVIDVDGGMRL